MKKVLLRFCAVFLAITMLISIAPMSSLALTAKEQEDFYRVNTWWQDEYNQQYIDWLLESDNFMYHLDISTGNIIHDASYGSLNLDPKQRKDNFVEILTSFIGLSYDELREQSAAEVFSDISVEFLDGFKDFLEDAQLYTADQFKYMAKAINETSEYYIQIRGIDTTDMEEYGYQTIYKRLQNAFDDNVQDFDWSDRKSETQLEFYKFVKSSEWHNKLSDISDIFSALGDSVELAKDGIALVGELESYNKTDERLVELLKYIRARTTDNALRAACDEIITKFGNSYTQNIVRGVLEIAADTTLEWAYDEVKDLIVDKCGIYGIWAKIGIVAGNAVSDLWFNTTETKQQMQTIYCLDHISELLVPLLRTELQDLYSYDGASDFGAAYAADAIYHMSVLIELRKKGEESYYKLKDSVYGSSIIEACKTLGWGSFSDDQQIIEAWYSEFTYVIDAVKGSLYKMIPAYHYYKKPEPAEFKKEGSRLISYNGNSVNVYIPTDIYCDTIDSYAFNGNETIESVNIPYTIKTINANAFYNCTNLKSVTINSTEAVIADGAFVNCHEDFTIYGYNNSTAQEYAESNGISFVILNNAYEATQDYADSDFSIVDGVLTSYSGNGGVVYVPYGVTEIGSMAFFGTLNKINSVILPDTVVKIGDSAFHYHPEIEYIYLGKNVSNIVGGALNTATNLRIGIAPENPYLRIVDEMLISSTSVIYCFKDATGTINVPDGLENISEEAFASCNLITQVNVPKSIKVIASGAFWGCEKLGTVQFVDDSDLEIIEKNAFYSCTSLKNINLPNIKSIESGTFSSCDTLESILIPRSVERIDKYAFDRCFLLRNIEVDSANDSFASKEGVLYNKDYTELLLYPAGKNDIYFSVPESVTELGENSFGDWSLCRQVNNYEYRIKIPTETSITNAAFLSSSIFYFLFVTEGSSAQEWAEEANINYVTCNNHYYTDEIKLPTCAEHGKTVHQCPNCEDEYIDSYTFSSEHDYEETVVKPTCTETGTATYTCVVCGHSYYSVLPIEHTWSTDWTIDIAPTETTVGSKSRHCMLCDSVTDVMEIPPIISSLLKYYVSNNEIIIYGIDDSVTEITIPEKIENYQVAHISDHAFANKEQLVSVVLPNGIKTIGEYAFHSCINLETIVLPNSITSIGEGTFSDCRKLSSVSIPEGIDAIHKWTFDGCKSLTSIIIPSTVSSIGQNAFSQCSGIESITLPQGVTRIEESAFSGCSSLLSVSLPNSIKTVDAYAFSGCNALENIYVPDLYTWCNIDFETPSSTPMYHARNLYINGVLESEIAIPSTVAEIKNYSFYNCDQFSKIILHNGITTIGQSAFYACTNLESIHIPSSVVYIGEDAFYVLSSALKGVYISDLESWCNINFASEFSNPLGYAKKLYINDIIATDIEIPTSISHIGNYAFYRCSSITSITIYDSVEDIGDYAFYSCNNVHSVFFIGTQQEWNQVSIGTNNTSINPSTLYFGKYEGDWIIRTEPTCTNAGEKYRVCLICGEEDVRAIDPLGHDFEEQWTVDIEPTTTSEGSKSRHCTRCEEKTDVQTIPMLDLAENFSYTISDNQVTITGYTGTEMEVIIPETIEGYPVVTISNAAFLSKPITSISIPASIKCIDDFTFYGCNSLTRVIISDIKAWCEIEFNQRYGGANPLSYAKEIYISGELVTDLVIPDSVSSIGEYAFYNCKCLGSISIPTSVTNIGSSAFSGCTSLTGVYISDLKAWCEIDFASSTANPLYNAKNMYINGELVTDLVIPDSVSSIGEYAFYNCDSLTSISVPSNVASIGRDAFYDCTSLASVHISDLKAWCEIDFQSGTANPLCSAKSLYVNGEMVADLVIPSNLSHIGKYAFYGSTSLTSVSIPSNVTSIGSESFYGCTNLKGVHISDLKAWCEIDFQSGAANPLYNAKNLYVNGKLQTDLVIPDSVSSIGEYAFYNCDSLSCITINNGVNSIGYYAFGNCNNLLKVTIPESVVSIDAAAFENCVNMESIAVAEANACYYSDENGVLFNKDRTCLILCPNGRTGSYTIPQTTKEIGEYAFENCTKLQQIIISEGVTRIGLGAFYNCTSLNSMELSYGIEEIGHNAFRGCSNLTEVTIPKSVTSLGNGVFYGCSKLIKVTIPSSIQSIGMYVFCLCSSLTTIEIPDSITSIADSAFVLCDDLKNVIYSGTQSQWQDVSVASGNAALTNAKVVYLGNFKFSGASLSLQHNLAINYKVDRTLFEDVGYTDPYVVFELNGVKTKVSSYTISGDRYIFTFRNIAPNQMNDTIYATLYATYNGVEYASETREYSVAEYCYSTLNKYSADDYAELRTLLVDLLHYGAQSQLYTKYNVDNLVDANLTEVQLAWGTAEDPTLTNSLNTAYETVENPLITWKGASLNLNDSVSMRFKFIAEDIEGLSLKITGETDEWTITANNFLLEDGVYSVRFSGLNAGQMSEKVYITMYKDGVAVSNTVCYSIESYAYSKQDSTIEYLSDLVKAMMKYGNSAYSYVN